MWKLSKKTKESFANFLSSSISNFPRKYTNIFAIDLILNVIHPILALTILLGCSIGSVCGIMNIFMDESEKLPMILEIICNFFLLFDVYLFVCFTYLAYHKKQ